MKTSRQYNRTTRAGFTLIELMVALMVLVIILGAFGSILLQCKRVVGSAEAVNRITSRIQAIGQILHYDLGRMNKAAVLKIGDAEMLVVTGDFSQSRTTEADGIGSAIHYSLTTNANTLSSGEILRRASLVLSTDGGGGDDVVDVTGVDLVAPRSMPTVLSA